MQAEKQTPKWQRVQFMPNLPLYPGKEAVTAGPEHVQLAKEAALEGVVLLKNEEHMLPFQAHSKLAIFGKAQADYVKGGGGSGDVNTTYVISILDGLESCREMVELYVPLSDYYRAYVEEQRRNGAEPGRMKEAPLPENLMEDARRFSDMAIVTISRFSGEGWDRTGEKFDGDYFLSPEENEMVQAVFKSFPKVCVLLNTGAQMDVTWFADNPVVKSAVLAWQGGMEGGKAVAEILTGSACPSGHLSNTIAERIEDYPSTESFLADPYYVPYTEDIFVGYRFFETIPGAGKRVVYPFGYGLSYTSFSTDNLKMTHENDLYLVSCRVRNIGDVAGREVVQVYCEKPHAYLDQPSRVLTGFAKTGLLKPGEEEEVLIEFRDRDLASYDDSGKISINSWVLEKGQYTFHIGRNVRDTEILAVVLMDQDMILMTTQARCVPHRLTRRMRMEGQMEPLEADGLAPDLTHPVQIPGEGAQPVEHTWERQGWDRDKPLLLECAGDDEKLEKLLDELTDEQMAHLLGGQPNRGVANTYGFGNLPLYGIPNVMTADGPAGLRIREECGVRTTAFPVATMLACTWNMDLIRRVGKAAAEEVLEQGIGIWLAPAMNIHRNPMCGRNFEYYSEDPMLSGKCASAMVKGVQSMGVAATIKHFACNNKETNRKNSDSCLSQRALREIYLKGFEICVREADPWVVMTSYNLINGVRASENRDLITGILREEWGFDGVVTTDWYTYGMHETEVQAGNDIKMGCGAPERLVECMRQGTLSRNDVKQCVRRLLRVLLRIA